VRGALPACRRVRCDKCDADPRHEPVTARYLLEEVGERYRDLRDGNNIRGIVIHT
jgi:hypothetical protein